VNRGGKKWRTKAARLTGEKAAGDKVVGGTQTGGNPLYEHTRVGSMPRGRAWQAKPSDW
jgi:hypothetical protein